MAAASDNSYYKNGNGIIHRVLNKQDIKQEHLQSFETSQLVFDTNSASMGGYSQMTTNQPYYERVPTNTQHVPQVEGDTYTVISPSDYGNNSNSMHMCDEVSNDADINELCNPSTSKRTMKSLQTASKMHTTIRTPSSVQRKRNPDKAGKGLRYFAGVVRDKLKMKERTTYNVVADEIVNEEKKKDSDNCDEKNIRRRIYDALNVLMAIGVISKDKKELRWIGSPTNLNDSIEAIQKKNEEQSARIFQKQQQVRDLIAHYISFKSLVTRNKEAERQKNIPAPNSSLQLPFIIINTHKSTQINCSVAIDKSEYAFKFDADFEMHDDAEVLKRMGCLTVLSNGNITEKDLERLKKIVPPNFWKYIETNAKDPISEEEPENEDEYLSD